MKNPLLKNNKTWVFQDIKHRTSHYNRILAARSMYDSNKKAKKYNVDSLNSKYRVNTEENRRQGNRKLVQSLLNIEKTQSRYSSALKKSPIKSPRTLKNYFHQKQQRNKIMQQNYFLYKRISDAAPEIGSIKQWKTRSKKLKKYTKILSNNRSSYIKLDQQFYDTFNKLKKSETNQYSLIKIEMSKRDSFKQKLSYRFTTQGNNSIDKQLN